jgi:hypothetical protein
MKPIQKHADPRPSDITIGDLVRVRDEIAGAGYGLAPMYRNLTGVVLEIGGKSRLVWFSNSSTGWFVSSALEVVSPRADGGATHDPRSARVTRKSPTGG